MRILRELACEHAACLVKLFEFLAECSQGQPVTQCPPAWRKLIQGLASSSPVCALLPPDDTCINLVKQMKEGDITKDPNVNGFCVSVLLYLTAFCHNTGNESTSECFSNFIRFITIC